MTESLLPPLGLYIHLPWCERKCPYCDFNSHETQNIDEQGYVTALLTDLEQDRHLAHGREISSLFIGGGTPSLFSAASIGRLLRGVGELLPLAESLEATMEANPGSAEAERFQGYREAGINRLSLGIQSFDDRNLAALGRVHSEDQAERAIAMVRSAGFDNFNLDLMHGLPGQSSESAMADLRRATAHRPTHLSWYQLTIEPNTQFYKRPPRLPVEDTLAEIQEQGGQILVDEGFVQYEVSAYSQSGFQCRHNRNYWSFGDYLGIGAGAHGKVTSPGGRVTRYAKTRQPDTYLRATPGEFVASSRDLDSEELGGEFMLNALRLRQGFSRELLAQRGGPAQSKLLARLGQLQARGLLEEHRGRISATALGWRFLDSVIAEFFED